MPLTDLEVKKAERREKQYKLTDGAGLYVLVQPDGARYWRFDYAFQGKRKTLALGVYPEVSLKEARERRDAARKLLGDGVDPSAKRKLDKLTAAVSAANTFKLVAEELLAKCEREGDAERTLAQHSGMLKRYAYPVIGDRPVSEITAPELLAMLRPLEARGIFETAQRLRSFCSRVFRYAIATARGERDPAADLRGALTTPQVTHRAAILDPTEIGGLLRAIQDFQGQMTTRLALRLAPLVFLRPGELRAGEWPELDLDCAVWRVPGPRMKMRAPHIVPLSRQAVTILRELHKITGDGRYLFPSVRSYQRPMSENTMNAALRRLGYAKDEMCTHGFRRIASTLLNEQGYNSDWIEKQLAHDERDEVRAAYNAAEYLTERTRMMQDWADYLDTLAQRKNAVAA